jgi:hypothetical protein
MLVVAKWVGVAGGSPARAAVSANIGRIATVGRCSRMSILLGGGLFGEALTEA